LVTVAVLVLSLSTAAWADRWGNDPHGDRYRNRYDDRYSNRYPDRSHSGSVADLAYELERTAESIHRQFERNNRRPNRDEARVAVALHELQEQARRFRNQGGGYRQDFRQRNDNREIEDLFRAYDQASESLRYVRPRPYVDQGMDRIAGLLSELTRYYGGDNRYDRYDRDRYDRDRYDRRPPHD
jgi:hypothetical protein